MTVFQNSGSARLTVTSHNSAVHHIFAAGFCVQPICTQLSVFCGNFPNFVTMMDPAAVDSYFSEFASPKISTGTLLTEPNGEYRRARRFESRHVYAQNT
jgi:hypothetical protein